MVDWLRAEWNRAGSRPVKPGDAVGYLEARSASVALASAGDNTHLHDFVDHMTDPRAEVANLNYCAHWIGELTDEQASDAFMLDGDTHSWTGLRLLRHLTNRLEPDSPLVASGPSLLHGRLPFARRWPRCAIGSRPPTV